MKRLVIIFAFLLLGVLPQVVSAAAVGIAPKSFELHLGQSEVQSSISVHNTGESPAIYTVYPDDFERLIVFTQSRFRLEPGEGRSIPFTLNRFPPGEHETLISIVGEDVGGDENAPKTGVKVPIKIVVQDGDSAESTNLEPWIIGLLLLAVITLVVSIWQYRRRSWLKRAQDRIEETFMKAPSTSMFRHYFKRHLLIVISALAMLAAGSLLAWSFASTTTGPLSSEGVEAAVYPVEIQGPEETKLYSIQTSSALSPFSALEYLAAEHKLELSYNPPTEMGVFVTSIAGIENGRDGKYWVYEVNGQSIPVAADRLNLEPGDRLVWKFSVPTAE